MEEELTREGKWLQKRYSGSRNSKEENKTKHSNEKQHETCSGNFK